MPRKCCVTGCNSNYVSEKEKTATYRLPKDPDERQRWIQAIPRDNIPDKTDTVVCAKHFLLVRPTIIAYNKVRFIDFSHESPNRTNRGKKQ